MLSSYIKDHTASTNPPSHVRLFVCGAYDVGKSAVTVRFLTRRFIGEYQRNVQLSYGGTIKFGPDVINFELKDATPNTDLNFLTTWPNCLAIIYSIIDHTSFDVACEILSHVSSTLRQTLDYTSKSLPLALIANKNDLEHYRRVSEEEGRNLALKYGASFWKTSASEDYNSVFRPLHSLIVETFLVNYSLARPSDTNDQTVTMPDAAFPNEDISAREQKKIELPVSVPMNPRQKSTPTLRISRAEDMKVTTISVQKSDISRTFSDNPSSPYVAINQLQQSQSESTMESKSNPLLSGLTALKRKRSLFKQNKSSSFDSKDIKDTLAIPDVGIQNNDAPALDQKPFKSPAPKKLSVKITPTVTINPVDTIMTPEISEWESDINSPFFDNPFPTYASNNQLQQKESEGTMKSKSSPLLSGLTALRKRRSLFKQRKSFSLDSEDNKDTSVSRPYLGGLCSASATSMPKNTLPSSENIRKSSSTTVLPSIKLGSSITINVEENKERGNFLTPTRYIGGLSKSFSTADEKQRPPTSMPSTKGLGKIEKCALQEPIRNQSQSCTDLRLDFQAGLHGSSHLAVSPTLPGENFRRPKNTMDARRRSSSPDWDDQEYSRSTNSSPTYSPRPLSEADQEGGVSESGRRRSVKKRFTSVLKAFSNANINFE